MLDAMTIAQMVRYGVDTTSGKLADNYFDIIQNL